jgi:hypothetical protein
MSISAAPYRPGAIVFSLDAARMHVVPTGSDSQRRDVGPGAYIGRRGRRVAHAKAATRKQFARTLSESRRNRLVR